MHISLSCYFDTELVPPILNNTTALEGRDLILSCINRNPIETSTVQMYDPNGAEISSNIGSSIFTISNITRRHAGKYTCVIISTVYADYNVTTAATITILSKSKIYLMSELVPYYIQLLL